MARNKSYKEDNFADLVQRLKDISNYTPKQERDQLMEAASSEPQLLDQKDVTLADIAKLAGLQEVEISPEAEKLVDRITSEDTAETQDKSAITKAIEESDDTLSGQIRKQVTEESKRLDKIAELEAQLAELKSAEKEDATLDIEGFKTKFLDEIAEFVKDADGNDLVELYNRFSQNEVDVNEDAFTIKTPETKEVIADAEQAEQEALQEKEPQPEADAEQVTDEASGYQGGDEPRKHEVKGDAKEIQDKLDKAGIDAEVEQDGEVAKVHTMKDKESVEKAIGEDDVEIPEHEIEFTNDLSEAKKKPVPTSPEKWSRAKAKARSKFDVYPSAYANAYASKEYKKMGGGWRMGKKKK